MKAAASLFLACFFFAFQATAQVHFSQLLQDNLELYKKTHPRELVYIHTDKEVYTPGETASFKAYIHDYYSNSPSLLNGNLFVMLIDVYGNSKVNSNFRIEKGKTSGDFVLPDDLSEGRHTLIGLTGVMQQGSAKNVFSKEIFIKQNFVPATFIMLSTPEKICAPLETTRVNVRLYTLNGKPFNKNYSYKVNLNGETIQAGTEKADKTGRGVLKFELPDYEDQSIAWVEVTVEQGNVIDRNSIQIPTQGFHINLDFFPEGGNLIHGVNTKVGFTAFTHFNEPIQIEGNLVDENNVVVGNIASLSDGLGRFNFTPDRSNPLKVQITKPDGITGLYSLPEIRASGMHLHFDKQGDSGLQFVMHSSKSEVDNAIWAIAEKDGKIIWSQELNPSRDHTFSVPVSLQGAGVIRVALLNTQGHLLAQRAVFLNKPDLDIAIKPDKPRYALKDDPNLRISHESFPPEPFDGSISITDSRLNPNWNNAQDIFSFFTIGPSIAKFNFPPGFFAGQDEETEEIIDCLMLTQQDVKFDWEQVYSEEQRQVRPVLPTQFMASVMEELQSDVGGRFLCEIESDQFIYKYVLSQDRGIPGYFWENRKELDAGGQNKMPSRQERIMNLLRGGTPILDVVKQIKHYTLTANKIIFGGPNSLVNQEGALIVVDGIKMGTEASILNTLNSMDIQNIEVFTDPTSMARYTSLNGVGVINITTFGKDPAEAKEEAQSQREEDDKAVLLWDPLLEIKPNELVEISLENIVMKSDFNVVVQGIDRSGRPVFSKSRFSVY